MQASWCAACVMRLPTYNLHTLYNDMQHHTSHAAAGAEAAAAGAAEGAAAAAAATTTTTTTTSGHSVTRASRTSSPCRREMLRHKQSPAQRLTVIQTAERPKIGSSAAIHQGSSSQLTIACILKTM